MGLRGTGGRRVAGGGWQAVVPAEEGELEEEGHLLVVERDVVLHLEAKVAQVHRDGDVGNGNPECRDARTQPELQLLGNDDGEDDESCDGEVV